MTLRRGIAALRCRWQKKQGRNFRSRAIGGPSRSRPGNGIAARWRDFDFCPPCGARKTVRAYAIPPVFRPLRKLRPCFFCHLQRKAAIPRAREGFGWAGDDVGPYVSTAKRAEATTTPTSDGLLHAGCHLPLCRGGLGGWVIVSSPTTAFEQTTPHPSFGGP